ncbi:TPA: hypothetical protein N0F65_004883 [Lagenidium giganteum]|uniref:Lipoxygenase domain-containing protein n=1 Tax=Lagenidium giganteum TaxID=4803 RepID=A0AAV2Z8B9_9STRA|nr:TPA: hypothetical protein N0F65_004883 [Lagenidium giganteum]
MLDHRVSSGVEHGTPCFYQLRFPKLEVERWHSHFFSSRPPFLRQSAMFRAWKFVSVLLLAAVSSNSNAVHGLLSSPNGLTPAEQAARASAIAATASKISNEAREVTVRGVSYPFCWGPVARPGSLTESIVGVEAAEIDSHKDPNAEKYAAIAAATIFATEQDYLGYYDKIAQYLPRPMSTDISDETFGELRTTGFSFKIELVRKREAYGDILGHVDCKQVAQVCGPETSVSSLRALKSLYVVDFSDISQWTDPANPQKYVPNIIGFFCYNRVRNRLLPFAIHLVDQKLTYTQSDSPSEWKLAKVALNAAEVNWQNMQHFVETHLMTAPVRVELMRHTAETHPVNALVQHHCRGDIALETISTVSLFAEGTVVDKTFAMGTTGAYRYFHHQLSNKLSIYNNFIADAQARGIDSLPVSKYFKYGELHWKTFKRFIDSYLRAYYKCDADVQRDHEVQNWAKTCSTSPQFYDFPSSINSINQLSNIVLHLVFSGTVRHHSMNGLVTWESASIPYSMPSLWKPWPTRKLKPGESLNIIDYHVPVSIIPSAISTVVVFRREVKSPASTIPQSYRVAPFCSEAVLKVAIAEFEKSMAHIEEQIQREEQYEKWPYTILVPSKLPYTSNAHGLTTPNGLTATELDARASGIADIASKIKNEARYGVVGGTPYPFCWGPVARPGSMAETIVQIEANEINARKDPNAMTYVGIAATTKYETEGDYVGYYDKIASLVPRPMTTDISDETFGELRMTGFAFKIARVRDAEKYSDILEDVESEQITSICGDGITSETLVSKEVLYAVDCSDIAQWTDTTNPKKYVPNIMGFFCRKDSANQLLPLAIHLVDQELTYTPFDSPSEWKLAKMALNAAEVNWQNMQHFVETHLMTAPVRVELMRTTATSHPVNALLQHHLRGDIALETISTVSLFASGTVVDRTFAMGASGAYRYFNHQLTNKLSVHKDFLADAHERGIDTLPMPKYFKYGLLHWNALKRFISKYLSVYYADDSAVLSDNEIQNWAKACSTNPQFSDFPSSIESIEQLTNLVLHLVFSATVRHHSMNGMVTWDTVSIPYSMPSLWKAWPTSKLSEGESLNVLDYHVPVDIIPSAIGAVLVFRREAKTPTVPFSQAYAVDPFASDAGLHDAITEYQNALARIEDHVNTDEQGQKWPYRILQPSRLPFTTWI